MKTIRAETDLEADSLLLEATTRQGPEAVYRATWQGECRGHLGDLWHRRDNLTNVQRLIRLPAMTMGRLARTADQVELEAERLARLAAAAPCAAS